MLPCSEEKGELSSPTPPVHQPPRAFLSLSGQLGGMLTCINKGKSRKSDSEPINVIYCLTNQDCVARHSQGSVKGAGYTQKRDGVAN